MQLFENVSNEKCKWMHTTEMYVCDNSETACNTWGKTFGTGPLTNINRLPYVISLRQQVAFTMQRNVAKALVNNRKLSVLINIVTTRRRHCDSDSSFLYQCTRINFIASTFRSKNHLEGKKRGGGDRQTDRVKSDVCIKQRRAFSDNRYS